VPFMLALSLSGGIYLFKPQIDAWVDAPYQNLNSQLQRSSANDQINAAMAAFVGAKFASYQLPTNQRAAVKIHLLHQGERKIVYVDPFTATVVHSVVQSSQFIELVRSFHGELLAGDLGSVLVELAGCWAIVLIVTGLYLWWPERAQGLAGVLYPRLHLTKRLLWRDLHSVVGVWISLLVLFLLISGLPWAMVWGSAFKEVRQLAGRVDSQEWSVSRKLESQVWRTQAHSRVDLSEPLLAAAVAEGVAAPAFLKLTNNGDGC